MKLPAITNQQEAELSRTDAHTRLGHLDPYYDHEWTYHKPLSRAGIDTIGSGRYWRALDRMFASGKPAGGFRQIGTLEVYYRTYPNGCSAKLADDDILFGEQYNVRSTYPERSGEFSVIHTTDLRIEWEDDHGLTGAETDRIRSDALAAFRDAVHRKFFNSEYAFRFRTRGAGRRLPSFIVPGDQTGEGFALVNRGEESAVSNSMFAFLGGTYPGTAKFAIVAGPATRGGDPVEDDSPYRAEAAPFSYEEEIKHYPHHRDAYYNPVDPGRNASRMENLELAKLFNTDPDALEDM